MASVEGKKTGFVSLGIYYELLKEFYKRYEAKDILVLTGEELKSDPAAVMKKAESFLGLPSYFQPSHFKINEKTGFYCFNNESSLTCPKKKHGPDLPPPDKDVIERLHNLYRPYNEKLFQLINMTFDWEPSKSK